MYFEMNKVIKDNFDDEIIMYQDLYDVRTWPIGIDLDLTFPIKLRENHIYTSEFDREFDSEKQVLVRYGKLTGRYPIAKKREFCEGFVYFILEGNLYQTCDKYNIKVRGKIFFTPFLDIFNYCCCWQNFDTSIKNLCNIVVNNQINPGIYPFEKKKIVLAMAKRENEKECIVRNDYARQNWIF